LITGGASGIGESLVEHFWQQEAQVAFIDIDRQASSALVQRLSAGRPPPTALECDLRDIPALREAIATAGREVGPLRVLVNNAARDDRHRVEDVTPESWDELQSVNLRHQFFAAQAVRDTMATAGGGSIVNFSSTAWLRGRDGTIAYTTAKAGVHGLTRGLAREFGGENIRVNTLVPGAIITAKQKRLWRTPELDARFLELQCLKYELHPAECARMALFLASDDSRGCTGQMFVVDGGLL
jgi:NAD(P)-dependent dehydrogenase (short-subunit alcohol dehydrogenase family)